MQQMRQESKMAGEAGNHYWDSVPFSFLEMNVDGWDSFRRHFYSNNAPNMATK